MPDKNNKLNKKKIIPAVLLLVIGIEVIAAVMIRPLSYTDISEVIKGTIPVPAATIKPQTVTTPTPQETEDPEWSSEGSQEQEKSDISHIADGILDVRLPAKEGNYYHLTRFSMEGRNYESAVLYLNDNEMRIISLKTKEDTLVIPSEIGGYAVTCIGGSWAELEEAVQAVRTTWETPDLGKIAWMEDPDKPYKRIEIQEGIRMVFHESFYGVKADELIFPASMELLGALSFADSEIESVRWKGKAPVTYWGAFLNTKNNGLFSAVSGPEKNYFYELIPEVMGPWQTE